MRRLDVPDKPLVGLTKRTAGAHGVVVSTKDGSFALDSADELGLVPGLKAGNRMKSYHSLLARKHATIQPSGFEVAPEDIHPLLFRFQRDAVRWSLSLGKAVVWQQAYPIARAVYEWLQTVGA